RPPNANTTQTVRSKGFVVISQPPKYFSFASSELNHDLDRFAVVHRAIAIGHAVEIRHAVEHATGLDSALHHIRHQLLDICAHRSGSARDRDVLEEAVIARWNRLVLRDADAADRSARASYAEGRSHRFVETHALED